MRLHTARYRWVNLLWISVVSVAVTESCLVWDLPLCVILSAFSELGSLVKCQTISNREDGSSFVSTFRKEVLKLKKCFKSLLLLRHLWKINLWIILTSQKWSYFGWGFWTFRSLIITSGLHSLEWGQMAS